MDVSRDKERLARLVSEQHGRVTRAQLRLVGVSDDAIHSWTRAGRLTRVLPRVYAVGHTAPSRPAELWAAVLYAGPGAVLSHVSAAHHRGLIDRPPGLIHVTTPRKVASIPGLVQVHRRPVGPRPTHEGIPTTDIPETILDLAATEESRLLRRALSVLDYRGQLNVRALEEMCGRGRRGAVALRAALERHQPALAHTNGRLEEELLMLCENFGLPMPRFNCWIHGEKVDAYWPKQGLVVEVDGLRNHSSPAQIRTDRSKDLKLRSRGLTVARYDWELVTRHPAEVHADLLRHLGAGG